jgi:hypothetical protein
MLARIMASRNQRISGVSRELLIIDQTFRSLVALT